MKKLLLLLTFCTFSQLAQAEYYCNTRFDYCVDVPSQLTWLPVSDNQGGRSFELKNSELNIWIYGSYEPSVFFLTDNEFLQKTKREYHTK